MSALSNDVRLMSFTDGTPPASGAGSRFTLDGSDALEQHLAHTCDRVREAVENVVPRQKLEAIILGGGYGRGQGGVLKSKLGDAPYNDFESYVCVRGNRFYNRRRYGPLLHRAGEALSPEADVEVEFNIISLAYLRATAVSMFSYDLVEGHRWILGNDELLQGCDHHRRAEAIPLAEATRLLMNRFSGLLLADARMEHDVFSGDDADFIGRNLAKAQLALGDAVLCALGQYHWSALVRHERLRGLEVAELRPWTDELRRHHAAGLKFKLHPVREATDRVRLRRRYEELRVLGATIWLWLENRRLGQRFSSTQDYALSQINKCPESPAWKNLLLNVRAGSSDPLRLLRAPRERLLTVLPLLLWESKNPESPRIRQILRSRGVVRREWILSYIRSWQLWM